MIFIDTAVYRMCEIIAIVPYKRGMYKLTDSNVMTDKAFLVAIGSSQLTKKLDLVSNSRITEQELQRYLLDVKESNEKLKKETKILTKTVS